MKRVLVIGASENVTRYSNRAIRSLREHGHEVVALGLREGRVSDVPILVGKPDFENLDTITLYLNQENQKQYYDYLISLKPKRIIYNPGAENSVLETLAEENGIENLEACTLVLLATSQF